MKQIQKSVQGTLDVEFLKKQGVSENLDYIVVGALVYGIQKSTDNFLDACLRKVKINKTMFFILQSLLHRETMPGGKSLQPSEISGILLIPRNTVSNALNQLERRKLIVRDLVKGDLRKHRITLTAAGRAIAGNAKELLKTGEMVFSCLDAEQLRQLHKLLKIIWDNLKSGTPPPESRQEERM
jgi:DNA-binding MarR family transcriptional regulator